MTETETELPKAIVKRIVKNAVLESSSSKGGDETKRDVQLNKHVLMAISECARVFISYVAAHANEVCKEKKRQTVSVEDVFKALDETDFGEFIEPLRAMVTAKSPASKASGKKRKAGQGDAVEAGAKDPSEKRSKDEEEDEERGLSGGAEDDGHSDGGEGEGMEKDGEGEEQNADPENACGNAMETDAPDS